MTNNTVLCVITHCCDTVLPMNGTVARDAQPRHRMSTSVRTHCSRGGKRERRGQPRH
jgi:hypothetical protein